MRRRVDEHNKERQRKNFTNRRGARDLPQLQPGDSVWLPDKKVEGKTGEEVAPQSFNVLSEDGSYRGIGRILSICRIVQPPLKTCRRIHDHPTNLPSPYEGTHVIPGHRTGLTLVGLTN